MADWLNNARRGGATMDHNSTHRLNAHFEGHVQGVGFRWTVARAAREVAVVGWVRNEPDGSVQLVAEGSRNQLEQLLQFVRDRMAGHIVCERVAYAPSTGEFHSFEIAR